VQVLVWGVRAFYLAEYAACCLNWLPWYAFMPLALLSAPAAASLLAFATENYAVPERIRPLKLHAIKWHVAHAVALCLGLVLAIP
jgi:hypothetical protein